MKVIAITNAVHQVVEAEWLARSTDVHRQLRTHLPASREDYAARMTQVLSQGAEMAVAVERELVIGIAVYRVVDRTLFGMEMYCDDLVTDEANRSKGAGKALVSHMEIQAKARGCTTLTLDSGAQRQQAHKFYFRVGFTITSFHFVKPL
jgi:GNAT superfamily N-acetyltransferase